MKRVLITLAALALLALAGASPAVAGHKTTICHVPAGNPDNVRTITISDRALKAHLGDNEDGLHGGDYLGECETPEPTPTPTPEPTPEPKDCVGDKCEPTPTPEPTPTVAPTPTPVPSPDPTPTPVPSESATPSAPPSVAPSPSDAPKPKPTAPPTDTVGSTTQTGGGIAPLLFLLAGISAASLLLTRKRA